MKRGPDSVSNDDAIKLQIASRISEHQFQTWFDKLRFSVADTGVVRVQVPNHFYQQYLKSRFLPVIKEAAETFTDRSVSVEFHIDEGTAEGQIERTDAEWRQRPWNHGPWNLATLGAFQASPVVTPPSPVVSHPRPASGTDGPRTGGFGSGNSGHSGVDDIDAGDRSVARPGSTSHDLAPAPAISTDTTTLNPDYTFDKFVSGPANKLAHAASLAVSEAPGGSYNPLFMYGRVGLGKTHLAQAVAHELRLRGVPFAYLSCTTFTNDFISAVGNNDLERFRSRYRDAGALIIDDVHFLADKERTQEEFFHTFNAVYNQQRQIVMTADCLPSDISGLNERLVSRFKLGLIAQLAEPAFGCRVTILQHKALGLGLEVPDDVAAFISDRIRDNVREIEGAVLRLHTLVTIEKRSLTVNEVRVALADLLGRERRRLQLQDIQNVVVEEFDIDLEDLHSRKRNRSVVVPRQVCMYLARTHTDLSLGEIGSFFGGRDHSTVLHSVAKIRSLQGENPRLRSVLTAVERRLGI